MTSQQQANLSDEQWLVLDLLMRARQKGVPRLNRMEILHSEALPVGAKVKLAWAALTMPDDLVTWHGEHDFSVTEKGAGLFNFKFGGTEVKANPTAVADAVICLPGPDGLRH